MPILQNYLPTIHFHTIVNFHFSFQLSIFLILFKHFLSLLGYKFPMLPTSGYGAALAVGSGVVVGALVLLVIAAVVGPFYSFRLCQVFRTCDSPAGSASYDSDYSEYPAPGTPYNFGYQKR